MTDTTNNPPSKRQPDLYVHTKVPNGRDTRIGARIGVGFLHSDGIGVNLILEAQPIPYNGQIELIAFPPKSDQ